MVTGSESNLTVISSFSSNLDLFIGRLALWTLSDFSTAENCITGNFRICLLPQIALGWSNQRNMGHVARMEEMRFSYRILAGKYKNMTPLASSKHRSEDKIKMYLKQMGCEDVGCSFGSG
jgi:hypothetical protein